MLQFHLPSALQDHWRDPQALLLALNAELAQLPPYLLLALGAAAGLAADRAYVRYLKRIPDVGWVTPAMTKRKRWIKGYVTRCLSSQSVVAMLGLAHRKSLIWVSRSGRES